MEATSAYSRIHSKDKGLLPWVGKQFIVIGDQSESESTVSEERS